MHRASLNVLCAATLFTLVTSAKIATAQCDAHGIGANKFDLAQQYLGRSSGGDGSPAYILVTKAMARKSLRDANRAGIRYLRLSAMGYAPAAPGNFSDLSLWNTNPIAYWGAMDEMFYDVRLANLCVIPVFLWNWLQIPSMTAEPFHELLTNIYSASWRMLERYVSEFVVRYRGNHSLYFYEISNELNLLVDLDNQARCKRRNGENKGCALQSNFTTNELIAFERRLADLIRGLDPAHNISSGFSMPRENAYHLRVRPEWSPLGADWRPDSAQEFETTLRDISAPVDIVSVHLYESNSRRFGISAGHEESIVPLLQSITKRIGKPLFIGEFGRSDVGSGASNNYIDKVITQITTRKIIYSAIWVWEFYQSSTDAPYSTEASSYSLEPGYTDTLIQIIASANANNLQSARKDKRLAINGFPQIVITKPLECAEITAGTEIFAIASFDDGSERTVYFYVNGVAISRVSKPPYKFYFPPIDNYSAPTAIAEVRMCVESTQCPSYKTKVIIHSAPDSVANCLSTMVENSQ